MWNSLIGQLRKLPIGLLSAKSCNNCQRNWNVFSLEDPHATVGCFFWLPTFSLGKVCHLHAEEYLLFLRKTLVKFPVLTWWLIIIHNSSLRDFISSSGPHAHLVTKQAHTCKQGAHTQNNFKKINNMPMRVHIFNFLSCEKMNSKPLTLVEY